MTIKQLKIALRRSPKNRSRFRHARFGTLGLTGYLSLFVNAVDLLTTVVRARNINVVSLSSYAKLVSRIIHSCLRTTI
jgi:hypothetical protein